MTIREEMTKRRLFFDGGMGTMLQERGLAGGELPELWNLTHPGSDPRYSRAVSGSGQ